MDSQPVEKPGYKRRLGRRTSDWLFPIVMWTIALSGFLAARHYYLRTLAAESMNESLRQQVNLLERVPKPRKP